MSFVTRILLELQETTLMAARAFMRFFRRPYYIQELIAQMDAIGVGSLTIILLTGFFTGGVLAVQTYPTLKTYGAQSQLGLLVGTALVRELGPVLCALMVTGRVGSAISAELGSMVVSEQIAAMRALLTVLADVVGIFGGWVTATGLYNIPSGVFIASVRDGISTDDIIGGVVKPLVFSLIIGSIACRQGLSNEGGTVGVGRSTTRAVVMASIIVIIADHFLAKALQVVLGTV